MAVERRLQATAEGRRVKRTPVLQAPAARETQKTSTAQVGAAQNGSLKQQEVRHTKVTFKIGYQIRTNKETYWKHFPALGSHVETRNRDYHMERFPRTGSSRRSGHEVRYHVQPQDKRRVSLEIWVDPSRRRVSYRRPRDPLRLRDYLPTVREKPCSGQGEGIPSQAQKGPRWSSEKAGQTSDGWQLFTIRKSRRSSPPVRYYWR